MIYYLIQGPFGPKLNYSHVEKLSLAAVHVFQRFRHYILFCKTTVIVVVNSFQYVLTRCVIGGKISKWIVILHAFDLDFVLEKSKKSLVFVELISKLPVDSGDVIPEELPIKGDMFLIASSDPWYGDILVYLQTFKFPTSSSHDERCCICHQEKNYLILEDTLYRQGVD
jgi:hypothetical protein